MNLESAVGNAVFKKIFTEGNEVNEGCSNPSFTARLPKKHVSKAKQHAKPLR
jgi:hypothetical protein